MIIQALNEYYERMERHSPGTLAPLGFERKAIPVILELTPEGTLNQIMVNRNKKSQRLYIVPKAEKRAGQPKNGNIKPSLLWDNVEYALGIAREESTDNQLETVDSCHQAFKAKLKAFQDLAEVQMVLTFLNTLDREAIKNRSDYDHEFLMTNPNVSFKLINSNDLICEAPQVIKAIKNRNDVQGEMGRCMVTGERSEIERLHPAIKGVWDAQPAGANIVSINNKAFESFKLTQGHVSPIGKRTAFQYTEALNHMLKTDSTQRMQIGDTSTVFWTENGDAQVEECTPMFFTAPDTRKKTEDPHKSSEKLKAALNVYKSLAQNPETAQQRFYLLGLAPNAARVSVRFWYSDTLKNLASNIVKHFDDIAITAPKNENNLLPLFRMLAHLSLEYKVSNLPPNLAGEVARSIVGNKPYPYTLLSAAIRRNKAEQTVTYPRAAILKGYLNRQRQNHRKEITMSLDLENTETAYLLGRWFAVLEKIQEDSHPGLNKTIKDKYYSAISCNPVSVYATLDRLKIHHLAKLEKGRQIHFERLLGSIIDGLSPQLTSSLTLHDQAVFGIGYYHQRQELFKTKKSTTPKEEQSS